MLHPTYSNARVIAQIDSGSHWTASGSAIATTITFGITTSRSWFPQSYGEYAGWSQLNAKQAEATRQAVTLWDELITSSIVEASDPNTADIRISNTTTDINYAHAYYPGTVGQDGSNWQKAQGSVWLNSNYTSGSGSLTDPDSGEYGYMAIIHELGHTLGLGHPGHYNGGSPTYANDAEYAQDTRMYSVMSYFSAQNTGADWYTSTGKWQYPQTPMVHDVLTIQSIYGANHLTRSGNTVYGFNANSGDWLFDFTLNQNPVLTIWDGAGNDTLNLSGWNTNAVIDLEPGAFSSVNGMVYNLAIAFGAMIENAVGGGGHDQIFGNAAANQLFGGAGNDRLEGFAGNDVLNGGAGADMLIGGAGNDTLVMDGSDNLAASSGGSGHDILILNANAAPTTVNLAARGIEQAQLNAIDNEDQVWTSFTRHYDQNWRKLSEQGLYDDGRTWHTQWDNGNANAWSRKTTVQDGNDGYAWIVRSDFFDEAGARYKQVGTYDSGRGWRIVWDSDDDKQWSRQKSTFDHPDQFAWIERTNKYNDDNRRYEQTGLLDDGRGWETVWDVNKTKPWAWQKTLIDINDDYIWSEKILQFDGSGTLVNAIRVDDLIV